ncbi:MAG: hypothetical protein KME64_27655 [Scytonematopsis contorta HA4267-MV1]|nr:hypothetical protein [Scytonematopsis contorta HA4267-MV1]
MFGYKLGGYKRVVLFAGFLTMVGVFPAMANLGDVWTNFQFYGNDLQNYLKNNASDTLKPLESQTQTAVNNSIGAAKVPNPNNVGSTIKQQVTQYSLGDKFENNSAVRSMMVRNEIERQITRGSVDGVFGRDGQNRLRDKLQNTQKAVFDINVIARNAATQKEIQQRKITMANPISQLTGGVPLDAGVFSSFMNNQSQLIQLSWEGLADLELQNINIQREQSKIMGETLGNTTQIHESLQYSNLNLANISQQMDEINRAKRVDTSAEVSRLLRVTSQTELIK